MSIFSLRTLTKLQMFNVRYGWGLNLGYDDGFMSAASLERSRVFWVKRLPSRACFVIEEPKCLYVIWLLEVSAAVNECTRHYVVSFHESLNQTV